MFARPDFAVWPSPGRNCPFYCCWRKQLQVCIWHVFSSLTNIICPHSCRSTDSYKFKTCASQNLAVSPDHYRLVYLVRQVDPMPVQPSIERKCLRGAIHFQDNTGHRCGVGKTTPSFSQRSSYPKRACSCESQQGGLSGGGKYPGALTPDLISAVLILLPRW